MKFTEHFPGLLMYDKENLFWLIGCSEIKRGLLSGFSAAFP